MKKILLLVPVFVCTISCREINTINSIPIEIKDAPLTLDERIESIRYLLLSFDSAITYPAAVQNIQFLDGHFYMCDNVQAKLIYKVAEDGTTKVLINKLGRGPGEYHSIYGMQLEANQKQIDIYDGTGRRNIKYTVEGEFLEVIEHDILADSYGIVSENDYVFYAPFQYNPSTTMEIDPGVLFYDHSENELTSLITLNEALNSHSVSRRNMFVMEDIAFLLSTFDNSLLKIQQNNNVERIQLDFGEYNLPQKLRSKELGVLLKQEYAIAKSNPLITDDYYFFSFSLGELGYKKNEPVKAWFCIIDKKEQKGIASHKILNGMDGFHFGIPIGAIPHENTLIYYLLPEYLYSLQKDNAQNLLDKRKDVKKHLQSGFPVIQLVKFK